MIGAEFWLVVGLLFAAVMLAVLALAFNIRMMASRDRALATWQGEREKKDLELEALMRSTFKSIDGQTTQLIHFLEMNSHFLRGIKDELEDRERRRPRPQTGGSGL